MNVESWETVRHRLLPYSQWGALVLKWSGYDLKKKLTCWGMEQRSQKNQSLWYLCWATGQAIQGWPEPHCLHFSWMICDECHCILGKATGALRNIRVGIQNDMGWEWARGPETRGKEMDGRINRWQAIHNLSSLKSMVYPHDKNNNKELRALKEHDLRKFRRNGFKGVYTKLHIWYSCRVMEDLRDFQS